MRNRVFGIRDLTSLEPEIWDWIHGQDARFRVITKRDPGNRHFEASRSGISDGEILKINSTFAVGNDRNKDGMASKTEILPARWYLR